MGSKQLNQTIEARPGTNNRPETTRNIKKQETTTKANTSTKNNRSNKKKQLKQQKKKTQLKSQSNNFKKFIFSINQSNLFFYQPTLSNFPIIISSSLSPIPQPIYLPTSPKHLCPTM